MKVTINGQSKDIGTGRNIIDLVGQYCKNPKAVITEVNGTIVPSGQWAQTPLKEGDTIELVSFVGGG